MIWPSKCSEEKALSEIVKNKADFSGFYYWYNCVFKHFKTVIQKLPVKNKETGLFLKSLLTDPLDP